MKEINFPYGDLNRDILRTLEKPSVKYLILMTLIVMGLSLGVACWLWQLKEGMGVGGLNHPVGWGVYITDFVFWVGIGHAGTLISAILFLFRARWRNAIFRSAEAMTIFAVMTAALSSRAVP